MTPAELFFLAIIELLPVHSAVFMQQEKNSRQVGDIVERVQRDVRLELGGNRRYKRQTEDYIPTQKLVDVEKVRVKCIEPGQYEKCMPCPMGYYKNRKAVNKECARCGTGFGTPQEGALWCTKLCRAGEKLLEDLPRGNRVCGKCERGTYQPDPNLNYTCMPCPENWVTAEGGSTNFTDCFLNCSAGEQPNPEMTGCAKCPNGQFKPKAGPDLCRICGNNKTTLEDGASSREQCIVRCYPGREYNSTSNRCYPCGPGTYKSEYSSRLRCRPCPEYLVPDRSATKCVVPECPSCMSYDGADPQDPAITACPQAGCQECPTCPPVTDKPCPETTECPLLECAECPTTTPYPKLTCPTCPTTTSCPDCPKCPTPTEPPPCPKVTCPTLTTTQCPDILCPTCPNCPSCPKQTDPPPCSEVTCPTITPCPKCPTFPTTKPRPEVTCPTSPTQTEPPPCPAVICPTFTPCPEITCPTTTPAAACPTPTEPTPCPARACPDAWSQFGDFCFLYVRTILTWYQAEENCKQMGGELAVVDSLETDQFLFNLFSQITDTGHGPWVGGIYSGGSWMWYNTQKEANYLNWNPGEPNWGYSEENCIHYFLHTEIGWNDASCGGGFPSLCQMKQTPQPNLLTQCFDPWNEYDGLCFLYIPTVLNWYRAEELCETLGGYLAVVDGSAKDEFLFQLFKNVEASGHGPWVGGINRGGQWVWNKSGAPATYLNWNPGEPNWGYNEENCIHYFLHTEIGWNDASCGGGFPSLCEMKKKPQPNLLTQCFDPWNEFDGFCFLYIPTVLNWYRAGELCETLGGYLAVVDGSAKDEFLFQLFKKVGASGHGPWVGGINRGGQWVWNKSGAPATYLNWNEGEPNWGFTAENCIHYHTERGWNDAACFDNTFPALCEMKPADQ